MKYQIGDKVRFIKNTGFEEEFDIGDTGIIVDVDNEHQDIPYCVKINKTGIELWLREERVELSEVIIATKEDLKTGDVVTLRNNDKLIYNETSEEFTDLSNDNHNLLTDLYEINDDMTYDDNNEYDVIKVERPVKYETIYTREVKKMTVAEICKELGYEVEIIKE